jgi:ABC-type cobalamin transport system permease subunit
MEPVMLGIILGAAVLGIIITVMEEGDFPGWGKMIICVLAALIPAAIINAILPSELFIVGLTVGALCAGLAISATCGMSVKRACIAAGIYLVIQTGISLLFRVLLSR